MTTATISAPAAKYLDDVRTGLSDLPDDDIEEVLQDLAAHIAELGEVDLHEALGTPEHFISEFRASAGLVGDESRGQGRIRRTVGVGVDTLERSWRRLAEAFAPLTSPLNRRRDDIRTFWIWSRGILGLSAYLWITNGWLSGDQHWLLNGGFLGRLVAVVAATTASVRLAEQRGRWWGRTNRATSLAIAALIFLAIVTPRYAASPEDYAYESVEDLAPALLIGPNGPIQNLYAYDLEGNQVDVLLYDEYGNPILTLPEYAYEEADTYAGVGEPFIWEGYELRFAADTYGRPIGNLYPLARYEWTETGARSAPQPPPVVGIPELPATAGEVESEPSREDTTSPVNTTPTTGLDDDIGRGGPDPGSGSIESR